MKKEKPVSDAHAIAAASLRANIAKLPSGQYLTAGQNQFQTLWTRDFCHAVRGLLSLGEDQVVKDHLSFLLNRLRPDDGLVPRVADNLLVQWRVMWQVGRQLLPFLPKLRFGEPLRPQYVDEHGSCAVDSNLLVLLASLRLRGRPGGEGWWAAHEVALRRVWGWYGDKFKDGLIWQAPFSDWQDCSKREGHAFLTNLFYVMAGEQLRALGWDPGYDAETFRRRLKDAFLRDGVFLSLVGSDIVSIEANLFALEDAHFLSPDEKRRLWEALKAHPLLTENEGLVGPCGRPDWPRSEVAWHAKFVGLESYHGRLAWSWLMGLGLTVGKLMQDDVFVQKQRAKIEEILRRDGDVREVFDPKEGWRAWESWLLQGEHPFSWGAGYIVEALQPER